AWRDARRAGYPEQRRAQLHQFGHRLRGGARILAMDPVTPRASAASEPRDRSAPAERRAKERAGGSGGSTLARILLEFRRPFPLVAPALGFASGAGTAYGAAPREHSSPAILLYPIIGLTMAAVLNAASNALNQIYDLEIDRVNKPKRPLPSGDLTLRQAWIFTWIMFAIGLLPTWLVVPYPFTTWQAKFFPPVAQHETFFIYFPPF